MIRFEHATSKNYIFCESFCTSISLLRYPCTRTRSFGFVTSSPDRTQLNSLESNIFHREKRSDLQTEFEAPVIVSDGHITERIESLTRILPRTIENVAAAATNLQTSDFVGSEVFNHKMLLNATLCSSISAELDLHSRLPGDQRLLRDLNCLSSPCVWRLCGLEELTR